MWTDEFEMSLRAIDLQLSECSMDGDLDLFDIEGLMASMDEYDPTEFEGMSVKSHPWEWDEDAQS